MYAEAASHVAIDLGASGGRVAIGRVTDGRLQMELLHRFPNGGVPLGENLYWDVLGLWREVLTGLRLAAAQGPVASIGVTTWGLDYALLDRSGRLADFAYHYRDRRTEGMMEAAFARMPRAAIYGRTGVQFLPMNTLWQLLAHHRQAPGRFDSAATLLMMPDLFHFWLCGVAAVERTNASTTQFFDPRTGGWARDLFATFDLPPHLLPPIVQPGTVLGPLSQAVARETGIVGAVVIAPATHDTASAVAAVPASSASPWAYVSSGTWSLVGVEAPAPVMSDAALAANLTNEAGVRGTTRLLKNMGGLWLLQECRRAWNEPDFASLYAAAETIAPAGLVDPDDAAFVPQGADMPARIQAFCRDTGQAVPQSPPEIARCIFESLALKTAVILDEIAAVIGQQAETVHVVGGGSQIGLLNRLLAGATGRPVVAGPVEATAMGNLLVQAEAMGRIAHGTLRDVVRASAELATSTPADAPDIAGRRAAFAALLRR
ncbi:MAG TPA: rhamnulokinase family protein [Acetobacteraceae bacterium]|nr:rhamnulokinase family protein [Acetobacteraceae bacterium]